MRVHLRAGHVAGDVDAIGHPKAVVRLQPAVLRGDPDRLQPEAIEREVAADREQDLVALDRVRAVVELDHVRAAVPFAGAHPGRPQPELQRHAIRGQRFAEQLRRASVLLVVHPVAGWMSATGTP